MQGFVAMVTRALRDVVVHGLRGAVLGVVQVELVADVAEEARRRFVWRGITERKTELLQASNTQQNTRNKTHAELSS